MVVRCCYCLERSDKAGMVSINGKNYHPACAQLYTDKQDLYKTINRIFGLKAPGPANMQLIKKYAEQGYTFRGMNRALKYFYDIKQRTTTQAEERIGIIPYVYQEAQQYFLQQDLEMEKREQNAQNISQKEKQYHLVDIEKIPTTREILFKKDTNTNPFDFIE